VEFGYVASWLSHEAIENNPFLEGGAIDAKLARAVDDAAMLLTKTVWRPPVLRRFLLGRHAKKIRRRVDAVEDTTIQSYRENAKRWAP
jgi:hypothetical protein